MTNIGSLREDKHVYGRQRKRLDDRDHEVVKVSPERGPAGESGELAHAYMPVCLGQCRMMPAL